ncbi:MAG: hypothetical protein KF799_02940 [Bdellovibrionales bacterium]|nr:hypothetical protein [Bdellovibrionales bacterium]
MEISLRDNQKGQGLVEYLLVLVVAVAIIMGGIWQLNTAFKEWANNYFGNYLACLLETGELPSIGGTGGDSGLCNQLFEAFSIDKGRRLKEVSGTGEQQAAQGSGGGSREERRGTPVAPGAVNFGGGRAFSGGSGNFGGSSGRSSMRVQSSSTSTYTGNTASSDYGGGYSATNRRLSTQTKDRLDTQFAFDETRERQQRRTVASTPNRGKDENAQRKERAGLNSQAAKKAAGEAPDSGFTIADFIRYLIIVGILLALLIFIGGQMLQIGKSME